MDVLGSHTSSGGETSALAAELLAILGGLDMESLMQAHDQAAALLDPACFSRGRRQVPNLRTQYRLFLSNEETLLLLFQLLINCIKLRLHKSPSNHKYVGS